MGMLLVTQAVPALLVAVIALTVVAAVLGASPEENRYGLVRRKLVGTGNLTTTATTSNEDKYNQARLDSLCDLGSDSYSHDVKRANLDFEFWYAIGTTNGVSMVDARKLFEVEQLLYTSIHENVLWCTAIISGPNATGAGIGNRRRERQLLPTPRLGPVTFTPGITDTVTEYDCPTSSIELMNATGATKCIVVHGQMRILAHPADSLSFAVAGLRTGLRDALVAGRDVGQKGEISNVAFLSYLGDTKKEALVEYGGGGGNTGSGITAALGGNDSGGSRPIGLVLGICVPLVAALLAAAIVKRKRSLADSAPAVWQDPNQTQPKTSGALVGTGDPPGSFHDGIYHYMKNGQRYLSTQCEKCLETKRNGIYSVEMFDSNTFAADKMKSILEFGTDDGGDILARADSSLGLSQHHMGIDVHKCQSALCKRCVPDSPQTTFVPVLSSTQDSRSIPSNLESLTRLDSRLTLLTQKMHNKELEEDLPDLPPIAVVTSPAVHDIQSASCSTISTGLGSSISVSTFGGNSSIFTDALSTKSKRAKGYFSLMD